MNRSPEPFVFSVAGPPATKGSWQSISARSGTVFKNDNARTSRWSSDVGWMCKAEMQRHGLHAPVAGPVHLTVLCYMKRPDAMDLDKILRAVLDALQGVLYENDKQVRRIVSEKIGLADHAGDPYIEATHIAAAFSVELPGARHSEKPTGAVDQGAQADEGGRDEGGETGGV